MKVEKDGLRRAKKAFVLASYCKLQGQSIGQSHRRFDQRSSPSSSQTNAKRRIGTSGLSCKNFGFPFFGFAGHCSVSRNCLARQLDENARGNKMHKLESRQLTSSMINRIILIQMKSEE